MTRSISQVKHNLPNCFQRAQTPIPSRPSGPIGGLGISLTMHCPGLRKALCELHQGPLTSAEIAAAVMQAKGMPPVDVAFKEIVAERALTVLRRLAKCGGVVKHGASRNAKWALCEINC
jgi:hypothetical protein